MRHVPGCHHRRETDKIVLWGPAGGPRPTDRRNVCEFVVTLVAKGKFCKVYKLVFDELSTFDKGDQQCFATSYPRGRECLKNEAADKGIRGAAVQAVTN